MSTIPTMLTFRAENAIPPSGSTSSELQCVHSQRRSSGQITAASGSSSRHSSIRSTTSPSGEIAAISSPIIRRGIG